MLKADGGQSSALIYICHDNELFSFEDIEQCGLLCGSRGFTRSETSKGNVLCIASVRYQDCRMPIRNEPQCWPCTKIGDETSFMNTN